MSTTDVRYQALQLRGLAGLLRAAEGLEELTNVDEVRLFIAASLDAIATALDA
jgi:hypothetical protein